MKHQLWILLTCLAAVSPRTDAAELRARVLLPTSAIPSTLIVGRSHCGRASWLLMESGELVEFRDEDAAVVIQRVAGLKAEDRIWGLACLPDGSLWTLASARTLARLDDHGRILERLALPLPRVALFAAGDRLLFQQMPIVPGTAVLMSSLPRSPHAAAPWPGLIGRQAATRESQLTTNLVNCGIAANGATDTYIPCWFTDARSVLVSDGKSARSYTTPIPATGTSEREAPIWDVALWSSDSYWLLTTGPSTADGLRAGTHLARMHGDRQAESRVVLIPAARSILSARETRCLLLAVNGQLIEVTVWP